jgi:signal transduction histidine kinase
MFPETEDLLQLEYELIGCELHDGPCQYVALAQTLLKSLPREGAGSSPGNDRHLDMALGVLQQAELELRQIIRGIQPLQPGDTRKAAAVERLRNENEMEGGPEIEWCLDAEFDELANHLRVTILRILQECLRNVRRHSTSNKALVGVTRDDTLICIQVQDWGVGFDRESVQPNCCGLNGIRRRAKWLGGTVNIDSRPGGGTCVTVELPLRARNKPRQQQT